MVSIDKGTYALIRGDQKTILSQGRSIYLWKYHDQINVKHHGISDIVRFEALMDESNLRIKPLDSKGPEKLIPGDIKISSLADKINVVNILDLDDYVAGVVEAESGSDRTLEYYKIQSIISRTYALANMNRHSDEGFNLCDRVHCQVYHGKSRFNPLIPKAVKSNTGVVITDSDLNLINASFHSNCGGQTINAEDVWQKPLPYLKARSDTFCLHGNHAHWKKEISTYDWINFFKTNYGIDSLSDGEVDVILNYNPENRSRNMQSVSVEIPLKELRKEWKLKSTNFSVCSENGTTELDGRGFGHGVGLCQEGAIYMAEIGLPYFDILNYYYADIHLLHLSVIDFFRDN